MLKLGYKPDLIEIVPPVLDNSKVIKQEERPKASYQQQPVPTEADFKPPEILDIDEWSDFEDE